MPTYSYGNTCTLKKVRALVDVDIPDRKITEKEDFDKLSRACLGAKYIKNCEVDNLEMERQKNYWPWQNYLVKQKY